MKPKKCQVHYITRLGGPIPYATKLVTSGTQKPMFTCERCARILKRDAERDRGKPYYIPLRVEDLQELRLKGEL